MRRNAARVFDEFLAASARTGDRAAFARLADRWQPKLLAHAVRLTGDMEMARDAVQDSWSDIVKGLANLKDAAAFPAWAYRITSRRAADAIRKAKAHRKVNSAIAAEPRPNCQLPDQIELNADIAPMAAAITQLPRQQQAVIALHYREGFTTREIAAALSIPAGTVKTRLMHARRRLKAALEGEKSDE